jgi:tetratricopeptide (TPR) repeat protein
MRLNPNLAEVQTSFGISKLYYEWNWKDAEKAFKRALELNPGNTVTYLWYGRALGFISRYDEALTLLAKAKELDPLSPILTAFTSQIYIFSKQYDKANEVLQSGLKVHPNHALLMHNVGELYLAEGRYAEAIAPLRQSAQRSGTLHFKALLGYGYALAGRKEEARKILNDLRKPDDPELVSGFNLACIYLALGEKEQALTQLEQGYEYHDAWLNEIKAWPWFNSLQNEARYQELIRKMNFPK